MGRPRIDITGQKFGALTVTGKTTVISKYVYWECLCDCGGYGTATSNDLRRGRIHFCCPKCRDKLAISSPLKCMYGNYRRHAAKRELVFELTIDQFLEIIKRNCVYCNTPPLQFYKKREAREGIYYNGIDRTDNTIGYTYENSVPCCKFCNFAKGQWATEDFLNWIKRLAHFHCNDEAQKNIKPDRSDPGLTP